DMMFPARNNVTGGPRYLADLGVDHESGLRVIEAYPYNDLSEQIVYTYWQTARDLQIADVLPNEVDVVLLKAGVLIDVFRYEMARAQRDAKVEQAALWRNESRAQTTEWESKIMDAIRVDRASDDLTFILRTT